MSACDGADANARMGGASHEAIFEIPQEGFQKLSRTLEVERVGEGTQRARLPCSEFEGIIFGDQ
eukprot:1748034-Pyramimonas_sp.AAC.1